MGENDTETGVRSGLDIVAFNVQRGRDHQLPTYPSYKAYCGYEMPKTWEDMTDLISPDHVHRLYHLYKRPADVDLYIAQNMSGPLMELCLALQVTVLSGTSLIGS